ncbi:MAG: hypothetical protein ACRENG_16580, partial [bacterium]
NLQIYTHTIIMINLFTGGLAAGFKFLYVITMSKVSLAIALMLWHQAVYCNGAFRFRHIARAVPFLAWELRACLNPRRWLIWLAQLVHHKDRLLLPAGSSADFLLRRDGHTIVDFFKKLSRSGISPPAIA